VNAPRPRPPVRRSLLLALGGDPREEPLLTAIERSPGRVTIARRCLDVADLLTAAEAGVAGAAAAALVSPSLPRLDGVAVARIKAAGIQVLALVERGDDASAARMRSLGVDRVLRVDDGAGASGAGADVLTDLVSLLAAPTPGDDTSARPSSSTPSRAGADSSRTSPARTGPARGRDGQEGDVGDQGQLLAVWGPMGAPGRTTLATSLADELARLQVQTLLADADTYGSSVGQVLGVLDEASGLAAAAREANAGVLDVEGLARCARLLAPGLRVLTGVTRADRWPELPASALTSVWRTARSLAVWTVVDCGFCLEQDEEIAFDTVVPRRNGATLATVRDADVVVAVGTADPVGLQRLIRTLPDLRSTAPRARVVVVLNQVRSGPVGPRPERRLLESLRRYAGVSSAVLVPADRDAMDAAIRSGRTLAETTPSSPARTALAGLAAALHGR